jgi:hypothetical protein
MTSTGYLESCFRSRTWVLATAICLESKGIAMTTAESNTEQKLAEILADPVSAAGFIQWIETVARDTAGDNAQLSQRRFGVGEIVIVAAKELRVGLGADASVGYPEGRAAQQVIFLSKEYACGDLVGAAIDLARPPT